MCSPGFIISRGGLLAICCLVTSVNAEVSPTANVLTNIAQVRHLPATESAKRLPVVLSGVMMDTAKTDPRWRAIILADSTASIYMLALPDPHGKNILAPYHRGDRLEVKGVTGAGQFAPIVIAHEVQKLGAAPIPSACSTTYQQLITGALDAQWVEVEGVVRQCFNPDAHSDERRIVMAVDGGLVQVFYFPRPDENIQVDAEVKVRAICYYQFNQRRQVLSPVLQVPRDVPLVIEKSAPVDPFTTSLRSPTSLLTFSPENLRAYAHRVHVQGVVTYAQAHSFVWIRDEETGLRIQVGQQGKLLPGDRIDVLGFPMFGFNTPELENAVFRKIGSTNPPDPVLLANFAQAFNHEDDLVAVEGTLAQIQSFPDEIMLTLNKKGQLFKAVLKILSTGTCFPDWQTGAKVRIAGICMLTYDDTQPAAGIWQPKSFQILMRSPADLVILQPSPWWTLQHISWLLGATTGALVLIIGVIVLLSRHRLRQQEQQRQKAEVEFAAILSERNRLAREIHDTLAQGLTATSVQLRLARKNLNGASEAVSRHVDTALTLVGDSLEEARNSIWNMRPHVLENGDLAAALKGILTQMADGTEISACFDVIGRKRNLASVIENNVLRIGQEAITNAIKHSAATKIKVTLDFGEKRFLMSVSDNGCGFDPQKPPLSEGSFGLMGMRERAAEIRGALEIGSARGKGTEIFLAIPLSAE